MMIILLTALAGFTPLMLLHRDTRVTPESCETFGFPSLDTEIQDFANPLYECMSINGHYDDYLLGTHHNLSTFFQKRCATRQKFRFCIENLIARSKQCLSPEDQKLLDNWEDISNKLLDYVCKNHPESALSKEEYHCWNTGVDKALSKCSESMLSVLNTRDNVYRNIEQFTCSEFRDVEDCMRDALPQYCNNQSTDLFATAINIIGTNTCHKSINLKRFIRSAPLHRFVREIGGLKTSNIEHKVKNLCISNGHESKKLHDNLEEFKTCLEEKQIFVVPKQEYLKHLNKCSEKSMTLFKECLPEKYKYIPALFIGILDSMISFLYDDFIIIGSELTPCLPKLDSEASKLEYEACITKIKDNIQEEVVDSKEKFCANWIPLNQCYITQIKKECKSSPELTKFENDFMEAAKRPCEVKK